MLRHRYVWASLALSVSLSACDRAVEVPAPAPQVVTSTYCATDFSCPPGQECINGACATIRPHLRPHIQTASAMGRPPLDAAETAWRASHYDLHIASVMPDAARAINPNVRLFEYTLVRFTNSDTGPKNHTSWAIAHGYDPEDFYLHYRVDTYVPTWEGKTIVAGFPAGMVPGWNPGGSEGPASALTRAQSRVIGYYYGSSQPMYFANIEHPGYREFMAERSHQLIDGRWWYSTQYPSGPIDGIIGDEAIFYALFGEGKLDRTNEYFGIPVNDNHPYPVAFEGFYGFLTESLRSRLGRTADVMPNYGHIMFCNYPNRSATNVQNITPWIWAQVWVTYNGQSSPTSGSYRCITYEKDYVNGVSSVITQTRGGGRRVLGGRDVANGTVGTDRGKLFTLGLYYLVHNQQTYYMYETTAVSGNPAHISTWSWNPAVDFNVGQPITNLPGVVDFRGQLGTREHYVFAMGADPYKPTLTYRVLGRRFSNALVLVKMLPEGSVEDSRSNTVHWLGGTYRPLLANGTLGAPITQASIRNNEALILIPQTVSGVR